MAHETEHTISHPTFKQYVLIATILFAITIVEFGLIWDRVGISDDLGASKIPVLILLSAIKFAIVIMFYMHLKFDNRFFTMVFLGGLALAFVVGMAVIGLFVGFEGEPRSFAEGRAIPYEEQGVGGQETTIPGEGTETQPPVAAGPIELSIAPDGEKLAFNATSLSATSGSEVILSFTNPSTVNTHNFVVVQAGTKDAVATDGTAAGPANNWVPPGDPRVIANTALVGPGESTEITFTAPAPGTYQFVCTFPGHNFTMFGDFIVN